MNYKSWNDEELRRVLIADPNDTAAICEAAERFVRQDGYTEEDLEEVRKEGYDEGREDGYNQGYDEGLATGPEVP